MSVSLGERRKDMDAALKAEIVPALRSSGFKGSYPNFRRTVGGRLDLLSFGFDRYGGGFRMELGQSAAGAFTTHWGKTLPESKAHVGYLGTDQRSWLGPDGFGVDSQFDFRYGRFADVVGQVRLGLPDAMKWFEDRVALDGDQVKP